MTTAIITGASRGLGFALAAQLADAGWNLIIDARDASALHEAADELRRIGSAACRDAPSGQGDRIVVEPIAGDITDPAHRAALIRAAASHGRLDLLINNAGTLGPSPLPSVAAFDAAALRETFEVNTIAPLALTQLALPQLRTSGGIVIDVTSDAAVEAYAGWGGYGASKAATEQLRNVLATEEAAGGSGVTVWRIDPGDLRTQMHQDAFPGEDISDRPLPSEVAPALLDLLAASPPSGRIRLADFRTPAPPRLWSVTVVDAYPQVRAFYTETLGLTEVDWWADGVVYGLGDSGRLEIARATSIEPERGFGMALEYPDATALGSVHARLVAAGASPKPIAVHPRGHSGFTVTDPAGGELYVWNPATPSTDVAEVAR